MSAARSGQPTPAEAAAFYDRVVQLWKYEGIRATSTLATHLRCSRKRAAAAVVTLKHAGRITGDVAPSPAKEKTS